MTEVEPVLCVEQAVGGDFLEIAALDRVAWKDSKFGEFIPDGEHAWRIWCEYSLTYVARIEGKLVGAIMAFTCDSGGYYLHKAIVEKAFRGRGIGSKLIESMLEDIDRRKESIFLTVDPENHGAIRLYENFGFTERTYEKGFYRDHEDRFILRRPAVAID